MAVSRTDRRREREPRVRAVFAEADVEPALDVLHLLEFAWHDCYQEISPSEQVIDDVLVLSEGGLAKLIGAAKLALTDWRDLRVAADFVRSPRE